MSGEIKSITTGGKTFDVRGDDTLSRGYSSGSLSDKLADLIEGTLVQKNEALRGIFKNFTLKEIKEKRGYRTLRDGSEVYSLNGVDIVRFMPINVVTETTEDHTKVIRISQAYKRLDK